MMSKLTGIKNCHGCNKREVCNMKNDKLNLSNKVRRFEHVNRSVKRHAKPFMVVESMCLDFSSEGSN